MNKGRGRPPGQSDVKERLLAAAQEKFMHHGYDRATVRAIAAAAGVDAALISYYFGSKEGLFVESLSLAFDPSLVLADALSRRDGEIADRLLVGVLKSWEDPQRGPAMRTFVLTAFQHPNVLRAFREYIEREVLAKAAGAFTGPDATRRATAAITVVIGLIFNRYILELAPAATMPAKDVYAALSPSMRAAIGRR